MFTKTPASTKGKYYVYTLSHPEDGMVFSIDKGAVKARKSLRERIDDHEVEAQQGKKSAKCDIIRAIWAKGLEIQKTKQPVEKTLCMDEFHSVQALFNNLDICSTLGISRSILYRCVREAIPKASNS